MLITWLGCSYIFPSQRVRHSIQRAQHLQQFATHLCHMRVWIEQDIGLLQFFVDATSLAAMQVLRKPIPDPSLCFAVGHGMSLLRYEQAEAAD